MSCNKLNKEKNSLLLTMIILLIMGCMIDFMIRAKIMQVIIEMDNINDFSLVLIQIQATIVTLTLSVLGILSTFIPDVYMGVSIASYYLEKNRFYLSEKRKIFFNFILLALSLIGYVVSAYNFVTLIFISSFIFILVSILDIYEVVKGKDKIEKDIADYVTTLFVNEENKKNRDVIVEKFIKHWGSIVASQSKEEFEYYSDVFFKLIVALLEHQEVKYLNDCTSRVALCLLQHDSQNCRLRGLLFVNEVYQEIKLWIQEKKKKDYLDKAKKKEEGKNEEKEKYYIYDSIDLIVRVYYAWFNALCSIDDDVVKKAFVMSFWKYSNEIDRQYLNNHSTKLDITAIKKYCHWFDFFTRNIFYVNLYTDSKEHITVKNAVNILSASLGSYLAEQKNSKSSYDTEYWVKLIVDGYDYEMENCFDKMSIYVPRVKMEMYGDFIVERDIHICWGYLLNGHIELVIKGLVFEGMNAQNAPCIIHNFRKLMSVHYLMYYMVKKGKAKKINQVLLERIQQFITDKKFIKNIIQQYIDLNEIKNLFSIQFKEELQKLPGRFKQFSEEVGDEFAITINPFILYLILKIDMHEYFSGKNFLSELKKNQRSWSKVDTAVLKREFTYLHQFLCEKELSEKEAKEETDKMILHYKSITR